METKSFGQLLLSGLLSGAVISAVIGLISASYEEDLKASIETSVETTLFKMESNYEWEKDSLEQLFGPLYIHLERSQRAYNRWQGNLRQEELEILRETNASVKSLILTKFHLVPADLQVDAANLVAHYDVWLQTYNKPLVTDYDRKYTVKASIEEGRLFPSESAKNLREHFQYLRRQFINKANQALK